MEFEEIIKTYTDALIADLYYEDGIVPYGARAMVSGRKALENIGLSNSAILALEDLIDRLSEHTWNTGCVIR
jgi:hypothetical protein